MDIHKPKPVHDWRELVSEIGVIVIGVLIALSGEQLVEALHWKRLTSQTVAEIHREYSLNAAIFEERSLLQPCADARLKEIDAVLASARVTHRLPQLAAVGHIPTRPLWRSAWSAALAEGVTLHMSEHERSSLASIDSLSAEYDANIMQENALWSTLAAMSGAAERANDVLLTEMLISAAKLRSVNSYNAAVAAYGTAKLKQVGVGPDYSPVVDDGARPERATLVTALPSYELCKPLADRPTFSAQSAR